MNIFHYDFILKHDPTQPLDLLELQQEWESKRLEGWRELQINRLTRFQVSIIPHLAYAPLISFVLILLIMAGQFWLPMIFVLTVVNIICVYTYWKFTSQAKKLKTASDSSVYIGVEEWVKARYDISEFDFHSDLNMLLSQRNENTDLEVDYTGLHLKLPTENYRLEIREGQGYNSPKIVVSNINGEAPLRQG